MNERTKDGQDLKDDLSNYDKSAYKHPSVTVDVILCTILEGDLKVLLIKRGGHRKEDDEHSHGNL